MMAWVDCDGVMAQFQAAYLELLAVVTGRRHTPDDVTSFMFSSCVSTPEEDAAVWRLIDDSPSLVYRLDEYPDAMGAVQMLRDMPGARVGCLTTPHLGPHWMHGRAQWLLDRGFHKKDIVFCSDKALVPGDVLIEDSLENANAWITAHPGSLVVLLDKPYNRRDTAYGVVRVKRWFGPYGVLDVVNEHFYKLRAAKGAV